MLYSHIIWNSSESRCVRNQSFVRRLYLRLVKSLSTLLVEWSLIVIAALPFMSSIRDRGMVKSICSGLLKWELMLHSRLFVWWRPKILLSLNVRLFVWICLREITEVRVDWLLLSIYSSFQWRTCLLDELIDYLHSLHSVFVIGIHQTFILHWTYTIRMILFWSGTVS